MPSGSGAERSVAVLPGPPLATGGFLSLLLLKGGLRTIPLPLRILWENRCPAHAGHLSMTTPELIDKTIKKT